MDLYAPDPFYHALFLGELVSDIQFSRLIAVSTLLKPAFTVVCLEPGGGTCEYLPGWSSNEQVYTAQCTTQSLARLYASQSDSS